MTAAQDRRDVEEAVALILADGGPVEDECEAARQVLAYLGGVVRVQWRVACALHGTDSAHNGHAYTKPTASKALRAATSNDIDAERIGRPECGPWRVQAQVQFGWKDA